MIKSKIFYIAFFLAGFTMNSYAQDNLMPPKKTFKVAILAPLYLDSVFEHGTLKNKKTIPRLIMPGVDFVQGAMIAFDTLELHGQKVEARIYDSKSAKTPVSALIRNKQLDGTDLIIGSVKEPEFSKLASYAVRNNVPFVSATYPNDGGIKKNPNLLIVNPTLKAHVDGIFSYLLQSHGTDNIYLVKQKNDNRIENYFKAVNSSQGKPLLQIRTISLDSSISTFGLRLLLDTTKKVVIIGASLDETFSTRLADAIYPIQKNTPIMYMGMPNWDGFRDFYKKDAYPDFPIYYTTSHFDDNQNEFSDYLTDQYFKKYRIKPAEMAYKGFETAYYFTRILLNNPQDFMGHINDEGQSTFHKFNFRPVFSNSLDTIPDYYENKHLFVVKILDGEISSL
jgi:hypothetical protein